MIELLTAAAVALVVGFTWRLLTLRRMPMRAGLRVSRVMEDAVWHQLRAFRDEAMSGYYGNVLRTAMRWVVGHMTRVALITIALLAVMAAPAQAWQPSDNAYMHKYEQAAIGLWGSAPDCPTVEYIWLEADPWGEDGVRGRAAGCRMWLMDWDRLKGDRWARREGFAWNCFLVLHEWGHLLGYDHDVIEPRHPEIERYCAREAERQYRRLLHHPIRSRRSCLRRLSCRSSRPPALLSSPSSLRGP